MPNVDFRLPNAENPLTLPAVTLWQPWGSLIILRLKKIESRTHPYFARLKGKRFAIHAGAMFDFDAAEEIRSALHGIYYPQFGSNEGDRIRTLRYERAWPKSAVLGTAFCEDHRRLTSADNSDAMCDCSSGRWGLILRDDIEVFDPPIPAKGHQGIWEWNKP